MSDEQDVATPGWTDPGNGRRPEAGATAVVPGQRTEEQPVPGPGGEAPPRAEAASAPPAAPSAAPPSAAPVEPPAAPSEEPAAEPAATAHPTSPVGFRPRLPRRDPLTRRDPSARRGPLIRMGPWAPVAGAGVGLVLGLVVVLVLAPAVDTFDQRLALVFVVLGLSLLGAGGTLLADEVRLLRRGAQAAEARASGAGVIAGLLNGLTPARLLITASAFCLLLSAYVTSGG